MPYLIICLVALLASGLTLFSGFGLGTLLLPAFALFFPVEAAVGLAAVVHLLNNLFKLALVGRRADWGIVLRFGVPGVVTAFLGAWLLTRLAHLQPVASYEALGRSMQVTPVKLVVATLMLAFAAMEMFPAGAALHVPRRWLPLGGAISGFFGGLSGQQGALRSAFLIKAGMRKDVFIATGVVIACMVDVSRLAVYSGGILAGSIREHGLLLAAATGAAFVGAVLGARLIHKVTLRQVQIIVAVMLALIALALGAGAI